MRTILCFGDSNTFGSAPMTHLDDYQRFGFTERWPGILRQRLGPGWHVIEEGLPGRTTARDDPVEGAERNALRYFLACLESHWPLDMVVLMLGTNDLKPRFGASAEAIASGVHTLAEIVAENGRLHGTPPRLLIACPAPILEVGPLKDMFAGGAEKSKRLARLYREIADRHGALFLDLGTVIVSSPVDGIHLEKEAHGALGARIADLVLGAFR